MRRGAIVVYSLVVCSLSVVFVMMVFLTGLLLTGCGPCKEELDEKARQAQACPHKYNRGDVVEVKPDHQKVVIIGLADFYCPSVVYYVRRGDGQQEKLQQELIYGLAKE